MAVQDHQTRWRPQPKLFEGLDDRGRWRTSGTTGLFEVLCDSCGDEGGPILEQSAEIQAIRGPYRSIEAVREAALVHRFSFENW